MRVIYKYPLEFLPLWKYNGIVEVPEGEILAIGFQNRNLHAWIEHDEDEIRRMNLRVIPTGGYLPEDDAIFKGSAISDDYCWHVYRVY